MRTMPKFAPGARVRPSQYLLRKHLDLAASTGSPILQRAYKAEHARDRDLRGTVIESDPLYTSYAPQATVSVRWDDGRVSHLLDYRVELAE
jgi:hypothetical protein